MEPLHSERSPCGKGLAVKLGIAIFLALFVPQYLLGDVRNPPDLFGRSVVCNGYLEFLDGAEQISGESCHKIATYLIESREYGPTRFLSEFHTRTGPNSPYMSLMQAQLATVLGDPISAYTWADIADRDMYSQLIKSGDEERASLYSTLLSGIKIQAIHSLCEREGICEDVVQYLKPSYVLGSGFEHLDKVRSDVVLYCLLRTDGYQIPVREVLTSRAFKDCI